MTPSFFEYKATVTFTKRKKTDQTAAMESENRLEERRKSGQTN
jgi:hypothetical protein